MSDARAAVGGIPFILIAMQTDPAAEWQRLTEQYRPMSDNELYELNAQREDLTEMAQQALSAEMSQRRLPPPPTHRSLPVSRPALPSHEEPDSIRDAVTKHRVEDEPEEDEAHEYTWKTELCECASGDEAWRLSQALEKAGIDNWIEGPGFSNSYRITADLSNPRILVAADQLEEAIEVAKRPIPKDIIELAETEVPEYEVPVCPGCGTPDPILESAEPTNNWLCEACGKEWSDPAVEQSEEIPQ